MLTVMDDFVSFNKVYKAEHLLVHAHFFGVTELAAGMVEVSVSRLNNRVEDRYQVFLGQPFTFFVIH
jgi:hypothetical protein